MTYEETQTIPMDEQIETVDAKVAEYEKRIRHIFDEVAGV